VSIFNHILVPIDFSPSSSAAIELALGMANQFDAQLTLVHVWELPIYPYMEMLTSSIDVTAAIEKAANESLTSLLGEIQSRLPRTQGLLKMGVPSEQIVNALAESKADLLIMGTHGRRGVVHALMGSVAEKLVRISPVPVLTVRAAVAA
jgi:nucleotide-binding universal stress UspA family protein